MGVNTADDRKIAMEYLKQNNVTFPNALDATEAGWRAMAKYETLTGMSAVPMTYLIGRDGKVVEAWYDYRQGHAEKLLKDLGL